MRDRDVSLLRPYLLTSGRTEPIDRNLELETQVVTSDLGAASHASLSFERRDIVALCTKPTSVAEIAAILGLHVGVARVLVADLAALGYVAAHRPNADLAGDPAMIERIIRRLEAIS